MLDDPELLAVVRKLALTYTVPSEHVVPTAGVPIVHGSGFVHTSLTQVWFPVHILPPHRLVHTSLTQA